MTYPPPPAGVPGASAAAGPNKSKNWMGITALIMSLVCCLQVGGLVFGLLGLSAAKRGEASNRGMSLFAVWWSIVGIAVALTLIVAVVMNPEARTRDFVGLFGAAGSDVAAIDEAIHEIEDNGGAVSGIGWDGENYYVEDIVIPAQSGNPTINFYTNSGGHCLEIVNSGSNASLSHGASCIGWPEPVLTPNTLQ